MTATSQKKLHPKVQLLINDLKRYQPAKIILFGSYARGNPSAESDVDLLVIKKTLKKRPERIKEVVRLLSHRVPSDVIILTPEEFKQAQKKPNYFMREVLNYGRVIT